MAEPSRTTTSVPAADGASRRPSPLPTIAAALALFFVAFEFLAFELRAGNDPSLAQTATTRPSVLRKVLRTKVVTDVSSGTGGGTTAVSSQPMTVSSAPAPAPAPVVTSSS